MMPFIESNDDDELMTIIFFKNLSWICDVAFMMIFTINDIMNFMTYFMMYLWNAFKNVWWLLWWIYNEKLFNEFMSKL